MVEHVTKRTRPDLDWKETPRGMWVVRELFQSDAYRVLSKQETDLLFYIHTLRFYPNKYDKKKKGRIWDYWSPTNGYDITIPFVAVKEFFDQPGRMKTAPPCDSTITRAIRKLMYVGFISIVELGGNGKGDMTRYRLEHNWRVWKKGDSACFKKAGLNRVKGFCHPGSGVFCPTKNATRN